MRSSKFFEDLGTGVLYPQDPKVTTKSETKAKKLLCFIKTPFFICSILFGGANPVLPMNI